MADILRRLQSRTHVPILPHCIMKSSCHVTHSVLDPASLCYERAVGGSFALGTVVLLLPRFLRFELQTEDKDEINMFSWN